MQSRLTFSPMLMSSITDQSKWWTSINLEWVTVRAAVWSQHISPATERSPPRVLWQSFILMDDSDWLNGHCHNPRIQLSLFRHMLRDIHMIRSSLHVRSSKVVVPKSLRWDDFRIDTYPSTVGLASYSPGKKWYIWCWSFVTTCCKKVLFFSFLANFKGCFVLRQN